MKIYRMGKSLKIFRNILYLYKKKRKNLSKIQKKEITTALNHLQEEILNRNQERASHCAHTVENWAHTHLVKTRFEKIRDFIFSLIFALFIATLIRTMWFEFYEIPTGSMRPTLEESDRLVVSKTVFGINIPLYKNHILFKPDLIKRANTIIFTGKGMDIADLNTTYFYLFPGTKQFVKRLIGKPGDTLYFYGGQIYGMDKNEQDISNELQPEILSKIDHVPYIYFNGRVHLPAQPKNGIYAPAILSQMNQKLARITISGNNKLEGSLLDPYKNHLEDYYDLWGFKTYGMARLLTKKEVIAFTNASISHLENTPLYMEIFHHPSVKHPTVQRNRDGRPFPGVGVSQTLLPLKEEHLKTLMNNLYTARFIVKDGLAFRYGSSIHIQKDSKLCVPLTDVPDGTYEFYYGKGYKVHAGGLLSKLPLNHPLYTFSIERVQSLYNLGIEWMTPFNPQVKMQTLLPSRYVYYRNGDLYALGAPLMKKDDATLINFIQNEYLKGQNAPTYRPYHPFDDVSPTFGKDGKIDKAFLRKYGLKVPPKHYLVLGDNYAMSADSRDFGFVPEANIRGAPTYIFWPFGNRFGKVLQPGYPLFNPPRTVIWLTAFIIFFIWGIRHHRSKQLPIKIHEQ